MANRLNLRNFYLYSVSFVAIFIIIFSVVSLITGIFGLIYPRPDFILTPIDPNVPVDNFAEQQRYDNILSIVRNGVLLLVATPVYFYHWRKIEREQTQITSE